MTHLFQKSNRNKWHLHNPPHNRWHLGRPWHPGYPSSSTSTQRSIPTPTCPPNRPHRCKHTPRHSNNRCKHTPPRRQHRPHRPPHNPCRRSKRPRTYQPPSNEVYMDANELQRVADRARTIRNQEILTAYHLIQEARRAAAALPPQLVISHEAGRTLDNVICLDTYRKRRQQ